MLTRHISLFKIQSRQHKSYSTATRALRGVPILPDTSLSTFRKEAFTPALPALFPRGSFASIPAVQKWFLEPSDAEPHTRLNTSYLKQWGSVPVPLEITSEGRFAQITQPLQFFLDSTHQTPQSLPIYLAQAALTDLPPTLHTDIPTPTLVLQADKGDIYTSSIWLGQAPTYTPLHRDPNPNFFVQLAGKKRIRLFRPDVGAAVFHHVRVRIGADGAGGSGNIRGVEMMEGIEREVLEDVVWGGGGGVGGGTGEMPWLDEGWECELDAGDAVFVPKGWWHSVKGVGQGMTGSVNWWFR